MRIVAAPVAQVMPVAGTAGASGAGADFGAMLADAGEEAADEGDAADVVAKDETDDVTADPVSVATSVLAVPVMQVLPPPAGGRVGEGGDGLMVPAPVQDGGVLPKVSVPTAIGDPGAVSASPDPSPRGGEGAFVALAAGVASSPDIAPAGAVMRDVSALLAAQPVPVPVLPPVAQAVTPPPVGVAEAAIREQVAALVAGDDAADIDLDTGSDAVTVAAMPATTLVPGTITAPIAPVLSADGALGLHVAAARAGQELDGITRDIAATDGRGDAPMRFRLDPAAPVPVLPPVAQAVTPPPVGVAEAAIREQVAALVAGDDAADIDVDTGSDAVAVAAMPATTLVPGTITAPIAPVLSADGALGLHVAAARAGQELDGITRDIAATDGSGDAPMRFRLDPAALGPVMVEVARGLDGLAVRIEARDGDARDLIADQQPRLVTDARAAGVQISTVKVEARREDVAAAAASYQQAGGQPSQSSSGQSGQRPAPQLPVATWTRPSARAADTASGPRAASELYA